MSRPGSEPSASPCPRSRRGSATARPLSSSGKQFVMLWPHGHHDNGFAHMWCAAPAGAQEGLVSASPAKFFRPPYVGSRGWIAMRLDGRVDWGEVETICEDAFRTIAPKRLVAKLDQAQLEK